MNIILKISVFMGLLVVAYGKDCSIIQYQIRTGQCNSGLDLDQIDYVFAKIVYIETNIEFYCLKENFKYNGACKTKEIYTPSSKTFCDEQYDKYKTINETISCFIQKDALYLGNKQSDDQILNMMIVILIAFVIVFSLLIGLCCLGLCVLSLYCIDKKCGCDEKIYPV